MSALVRPAERGSASVLAVVLVGALSVAAALVAAVGAVVADQRRVASAADLAALAGAAAVQAGRDGCARAGAVAHRNEARIASCVVTGDVVLVRTTRRTAPLLGRRVTVSSQARAGPVDAAP